MVNPCPTGLKVTLTGFSGLLNFIQYVVKNCTPVSEIMSLHVPLQNTNTEVGKLGHFRYPKSLTIVVKKISAGAACYQTVSAEIPPSIQL